MKPELMWLVWSVVLCLVQMLVAVSGATLQVGLPKLAGNRDDVAPFTGWVGRAQRAHHNMLENLPLFAALVLVAVLADRTSSTTALGAEVFFWGRLAYAVVYLVGIPWLRTAVWLVSVVGMLLVLLQLLS